MHSVAVQVQDKYGLEVQALFGGSQLFSRDSDVIEQLIQKVFYSVSYSFVVSASIGQVKGL